jgi:hypothetical protein
MGVLLGNFREAIDQLNDYPAKKETFFAQPEAL